MSTVVLIIITSNRTINTFNIKSPVIFSIRINLLLIRILKKVNRYVMNANAAILSTISLKMPSVKFFLECDINIKLKNENRQINPCLETNNINRNLIV